MDIIIFFIYFFYFLYGFKIYKLAERVGISFQMLVLLFVSKVFFGCLNLYFHNATYLTNDAHAFYLEGLVYLKDFKNQPSFYIHEWLFNWGDITNHLNFFKASNSVFWSDIGRLMHTRFMILCNVFTMGSEYANVIFYNVIYFLGQLALLKSLMHFQPNKKWIYISLIFFLPGTAFWCSGIHKDGFVLAAFGMVAWSTINYTKHKSSYSILLLVLSLLGLLAIRYFYFLCFLPPYLLWLFFPTGKNVIRSFGITYSIALGLFLNSHQINSSIRPMELVINKQIEFFKSKGYSDMLTPKLEHNATSFLQNTDVALSHIFIEPIPKLNKRLKYAITAMDSALVLILLLFSIFYIRKDFTLNAYYWLLVCFSLSILLFIGYTIPNLGALVRYKSPFILLLLLGISSMANYPNWLKKYYLRNNPNLRIQ